MRLPRREDPPAHGPIDDPDQDFPGSDPARIDPPPAGGPKPDAPVREPEMRARVESTWPSSWSARCTL